MTMCPQASCPWCFKGLLYLHPQGWIVLEECLTLKMKAPWPFKTLGIVHPTTWHCISEDLGLPMHINFYLHYQLRIPSFLYTILYIWPTVEMLHGIWQQLSNFNKHKKKSQWVIIINLLFKTMNQLDVSSFHTATTRIVMLKYHCCHAMLWHNGTIYLMFK